MENIIIFKCIFVYNLQTFNMAEFNCQLDMENTIRMRNPLTRWNFRVQTSRVQNHKMGFVQKKKDCGNRLGKQKFSANFVSLNKQVIGISCSLCTLLYLNTKPSRTSNVFKAIKYFLHNFIWILNWPDFLQTASDTYSLFCQTYPVNGTIKTSSHEPCKKKTKNSSLNKANAVLSRSVHDRTGPLPSPLVFTFHRRICFLP